jgi:hypothetical protein
MRSKPNGKQISKNIFERNARVSKATLLNSGEKSARAYMATTNCIDMVTAQDLSNAKQAEKRRRPCTKNLPWFSRSLSLSEKAVSVFPEPELQVASSFHTKPRFSTRSHPRNAMATSRLLCVCLSLLAVLAPALAVADTDWNPNPKTQGAIALFAPTFVVAIASADVLPTHSTPSLPFFSLHNSGRVPVGG